MNICPYCVIISGFSRWQGVRAINDRADDLAPAALDRERLPSPTGAERFDQQESTARALFAATVRDPKRAENMISLRMERQAILSRPEPPNVVALIDESVLHRLIGSPEIMREQLQHILRLCDTFVVQVVPSRIGASAGLGGAITLAAQTGAPEVLAAEALVEDQVTNDVSTVLEAAVTFDRIRADARGRAESRNAIQEALEKWDS